MKVLNRDELVRAVTAFPDFAAMEASMRGGYVPTLRTFAVPFGEAGVKGQMVFNERLKRLRRAVLAAGYRYFADGKVVGG